MTEIEFEQYTEWLADEKNMEKLSLSERITVLLANIEYIEKIEPIIKRNMIKDDKQTFLFKILRRKQC